MEDDIHVRQLCTHKQSITYTPYTQTNTHTHSHTLTHTLTHTHTEIHTYKYTFSPGMTEFTLSTKLGLLKIKKNL